MSFLDALFGSGPKVKTIKTTFSDRLDPTQMNAEGTLGSTFKGGPSGIFPQYNGQLAAPLDPSQIMSLSALESALPGLGGAASGAGGTIGTADTALTGILQSGPQDWQSYFTSSVLPQLTHTFNDITMPSIVSALGGSEGGPQSSAAARAVSEAGNNFQNTVASTMGGLAYNAYKDNQQQKLAAASEAPGVANAPINALIQSLYAGQVPQQVAQAADTLPYQAFVTNNQFTQSGIGDILSLLGIQTEVPDQNVVMPGQTGIIPGLINAIGNNAGFGKALGSAIFGTPTPPPA